MKTQKKLAGSSVKVTSPNAESPPTAMAPIKTRGKTKQIRFFLKAMLLLPLGIVLGKPANAQENWVYEKGGAVPLDAVAGGAEDNGTLIYICRAFYAGGVHPGRVRPGTGGCHIGWGGTEHVIPFYEVLVPEWASASNGTVPTGAYPYGEEANAGPFLYSCRGYLNGSMHPGKVRAGLPGCAIGWGGQERFINPYQVLLEENANELPVTNYQLNSGSIPFRFGPIPGGFEVDGRPLYVCLAAFNGGFHPGKTRPGLGSCNIGWGGDEQAVPLQNSSVMILNWVQRSNLHYLSFPVGNEANGERLHVCVAYVAGVGSYPGKYSLSLGSCSIGLNGSEVLSSNFAILTNNTPPLQ